MCLACEQDAIWLAYLDSRDLLKPDDPEAVDALFGAFPVQPLPMQQERSGETAAPPRDVARDPVGKNLFSCDDPTS